ncbi:MAG: alpha-galactosidase [Roseobacter sp.]
MTRCWRLDDARQTLVLGAQGDHCPKVVYWGAALPAGEDLEALMEAQKLDVTGGMLDAIPDLSLCPEASRSFPGQPGMVVHHADGCAFWPELKLHIVEQSPFKLRVICKDGEDQLTYTACIDLDPETHVLTLQSRLTSETPVQLHWLAAPVVPAPQDSEEMIDLAGRWCGEFQINRTRWSPGIRYRENRTGRSGHEHFPGLIVPCRGATNAVGEAYAFHYGWSGGHRMIAEELPDGRRQIQFGHALWTQSGAATEFQSAPLYAVYSAEGVAGCAVSFQRHVRERIITWPERALPRPVHYNCWEAVYFDHSVAELCKIATLAASLGAERFVLDDGWFGQRDDDTSSLADWVVDRRKYPDGLGPLIDHVRSEGMQFGIWFEPEMINPDSDTYRAHPEWALGARDQILGRQQKVLNMALPDVLEYLYARISAVLEAYAIDYIKWDHNRVLPMPDVAQTQGTYTLLDRLRAAFPQIEIESCASGGGRIDFGILTRTQRVWLSDSNDALERLKMQHNAAFFLPSAVTGSHVGPRRCHTSGRVLDMEIRAWVAAQRHMGFEMDPRELTPEEAEVLRDVTRWWKANRDWLFDADILPLDSSDPAVIAEQQMDRNATRFVVFAGQVTPSSQSAPRPLRLVRLDPQASYRISLRNRGAAHHLSRAPLALKERELTLSGAALMSAGLRLPWRFPQTMWVIEGQKING